jgi:Peptidase family M23
MLLPQVKPKSVRSPFGAPRCRDIRWTVETFHVLVHATGLAPPVAGVGFRGCRMLFMLRAYRSIRPADLEMPWSPCSLAALAAVAFVSCSSPTDLNHDVCTGYPDPQTSAYVLPYPVGVSYPLWQGNCSGQGHSGYWRYSYDFKMPIGSIVTAARGGEVIYTRAIERDDGPHDANAPPNLVFIQHDDSSMDVYSHLMHEGVRVTVGQIVQAGDTIALSGNTGYTDNHPHLHFSVHGCRSVPGFEDGPLCPALPVTFRNAQPQDGVLLQAHDYTAGPH